MITLSIPRSLPFTEVFSSWLIASQSNVIITLADLDILIGDFFHLEASVS